MKSYSYFFTDSNNADDARIIEDAQTAVDTKVNVTITFPTELEETSSIDDLAPNEENVQNLSNVKLSPSSFHADNSVNASLNDIVDFVEKDTVNDYQLHRSPNQSTFEYHFFDRWKVLITNR